MPLAIRRAVPYAPEATSACNSTRIGRVPSAEHSTTEPGTLAARSDLEQYLVLADSFEVDDPARRAVVERLLEDLTPARTSAR